MLDEQKVAFNTVLSSVLNRSSTDQKRVIIITGGPSTGKSVIAVQLLAELARHGVGVVHCTGSAAFITTLRAHVGRKGSSLFKFFNSFSNNKHTTWDVLIADEAHRIRESSNSWYTPKSNRSNKTQIEELIGAARISVFFLDTNQIVRPNEVGTPELIKAHAENIGADIICIDLKTQFRCSGSKSYLEWLDYVLGLGKTYDNNWIIRNEYEFKILDTPEELEELITEKYREGYSARIVAGFCWPWSDPQPDGSLVPDVRIGNWSKPWNRKRPRGRLLPPVRDPYFIWAT